VLIIEIGCEWVKAIRLKIRNKTRAFLTRNNYNTAYRSVRSCLTFSCSSYRFTDLVILELIAVILFKFSQEICPKAEGLVADLRG